MTASFARLRRAAAAAVIGLAAACSTRHPPSPVSTPSASPGMAEEGIASWYGGKDGFEGKPTASGEIYDGSQMTAAHRTLPLGTIVDVRNLDNGKTLRLRINDRGPFVKGRILDLSRAAASNLGVIGPGTASVRLMVVAAGAEAPLTSSTGLWSVQVGSFAERDRADRFAQRVRDTGRTVYLEPYRGLSRVKVGPYDSRSNAQDGLDHLREDGFEGIVVPAGK